MAHIKTDRASLPTSTEAQKKRPVFQGSLGIMEMIMETTIVYWGYIGIMEKENGSHCRILGLCLDNGKENGNYYSTLG